MNENEPVKKEKSNNNKTTKKNTAAVFWLRVSGEEPKTNRHVL